MGYRLLSISGDSKFLELLRACASRTGNTLSTAGMGAQGLQLVMDRRPDLLFLDTQISDMEGLACLKILRQTDQGRDLPVIVVNIRKADADVIEAYEWGADDYILKNCAPEELAWRIRAVLRRRFERPEQVGFAMSLGPVGLDPSRHECRVRDKRVMLKGRQFELLEILMRKAGRVLSRIYLLEAIWGMNRSANTRAVDVAVSRLRKALGPGAGRLIETIERFGYLFRDPGRI